METTRYVLEPSIGATIAIGNPVLHFVLASGKVDDDAG